MLIEIIKSYLCLNLNLVIFKNQELSLPNNFNWAAQINLPLVYNDLVLELKRINEVTKINKRKYKLGDFFFNPKTSELLIENSSTIINLTELESKFLNYMLKKKNGATKSEILKEVWNHNNKLNTHTLESLIYRLRKKIEKNPNRPLIIVNDTNRYLINS